MANRPGVKGGLKEQFNPNAKQCEGLGDVGNAWSRLKSENGDNNKRSGLNAVAMHFFFDLKLL